MSTQLADPKTPEREALEQVALLHSEWGATGNHFEAFKALREILNNYYLRNIRD